MDNRVRRCRPLLGTYVEIAAAGPADTSTLHRCVDRAYAAIEQVHGLMSFHSTDSDLSRLNARAHLEPQQVHTWTWEVISGALALSHETNGRFDISIGATLQSLGLLPGTSPTDRSAGFRDIELLDDMRVRFHRRLSIDLGGIAKGYAVDRAIGVLAEEAGVLSHAIVNAGGDLRVWGESAPRYVEVCDPARPLEDRVRVTMPRDAVATTAHDPDSSLEVAMSAVIRPADGRALQQYGSVSVFADTCMEADALTKAVLLMPDDEAERLLHAHGACALRLPASTARNTAK